MRRANEKGCEINTNEGVKKMKGYRNGRTSTMELFNIKKWASGRGME
jgi:hypothetical protein